MGRQRDLKTSGKIVAGQAVFDHLDLPRRPGGDHLTAALSRARAQVNQPIGRAHRILVMLDDQYRIAQIAQAGKRLNQTFVVALMQANRRLIKDIQHPR